MSAPSLVGLTGLKRSGKDTVAGFMAGYGYRPLALATPLKQIALALDPFVDGDVRLSEANGRFGQEIERLRSKTRDAFLHWVNPEVLINNAVAQDIINALDPFVNGNGRLRVFDSIYGEAIKDTAVGPEARRTWQRLGTDAGRNVLGNSLWTDIAQRRLQTMLATGLDRIAVTDVRFDDEAEWVKSLGGSVLEIVRPGLKSVDSHASEAGVDERLIDSTIVNDGTLDELAGKAIDWLFDGSEYELAQGL